MLVGVCTLGAPRGASAPALAVRGDHFTVDGNAKLLSFVMYFDALNVPDDRLQIDVNHLKNAVHVDGIRIMPSWWALTLTGDIPDLRAYGWNDWASSMRIF